MDIWMMNGYMFEWMDGYMDGWMDSIHNLSLFDLYV